MVGGGGVRLAAESVVKQAEFFVAVDARQDERSATREAFVRIASAIDVGWLEEMFPGQVRREREFVFDEGRGRIVAHARTWYRDLLLREDKDAPVDAATATEAMAAVVRQRAGEIFRADEPAAAVLDRVALLREKMPEQPWPKWDDAALGEVLANSAGNARGLEEVRRLPLASILKSSLPYPLDRMLEKEAPEALEVPSGNHIRLRYSPTEVVLAVRLQELFGWPDTPRIAGGRVPVKLELLGPNYRPVQVTSDLKSFWANTYFQVRKDLKARYPKHSWPEDPLTARAEAKGGRRR
jgi:ATP-dependent helicase HrpB